MRSHKFRKDMEQEFKLPWKTLNALIKDATHPYELKLTWKCIALGRRRVGGKCIFALGGRDDPNITNIHVIRNETFIRFAGSDIIWRFMNGPEMVQMIDEFDEDGHTVLEEGDVGLVLPPKGARTRGYSIARRQLIKKGDWKVKPRGPDGRPRKSHVPTHHFRPR